MGPTSGECADPAPVSARPTPPFKLSTVLLWVQGLYYLATGVWPLLSIQTFQMVTGPKTDHLVTGREADHWLVMTVGVLITAIAITLLVAAWRRQNPPEVAILAVASAIGLTAIDTIYVVRQVIGPIYLADAAPEVLLIAAWALALIRQRRDGAAVSRSKPLRHLPVGAG
jgi:hypothetical protein